jgi:hypothetical protein
MQSRARAYRADSKETLGIRGMSVVSAWERKPRSMRTVGPARHATLDGHAWSGGTARGTESAREWIGRGRRSAMRRWVMLRGTPLSAREPSCSRRAQELAGLKVVYLVPPLLGVRDPSTPPSPGYQGQNKSVKAPEACRDAGCSVLRSDAAQCEAAKLTAEARDFGSVLVKEPSTCRRGRR